MLAQRALSGVLWSFLEQLLSRGISIVVTLILARLLTPQDFGLLATMTVFIAVATTLMESGIREAVIRKIDPDSSYYSTAFYANLFLGVISYATLFICAPYIANFYEEVRLTELIRVAGVVVIVNAFQSIQVAMLSRDLNFKVLLRANIPGALISGLVAVVLALLDYGVWALIAQTLVSATVVVLIFWNIQPWRPSVTFSVSALKEMYSFGYKLFLSGLLDTIAKNIYVLVIAKFFAVSIAGLYFFAERIKDLIVSQLVASVQKVTYPALSKLQEDDIRLKQGYRSVMQVTTFMMFPAMLMLAALAEPLFESLFPDRWMPAVPYLQLMCLAGVLYPVHAINLNILKVKGRSDLFLGLEVFKKFILFTVLFISFRYGVTGILIGKCIQTLISYIPNSYYSKRLISYTVREQFSDVLPSLMLASIISFIVFLLARNWDIFPILELVILSFLGLSSYILLAKLFKLVGYQMAESLLISRFRGKTGQVRTH